ncbi:hypothetical protein [Pseudomonas sp. S9]|uniref:hypothetical protein n=1 Tax=Pseudomonas sp. S9 TaxID=686578 RepID=UPI0002DB5CFD|nr:hypothetical protein [Pseudomonas sp. S9]
MDKKGLARSIARRYAAQMLRDDELHARAFEDEELSKSERLEAHAELKRIARSLCKEIDH